MTPQRLELQKHRNVMFCWLVPRHKAEIAAAMEEQYKKLRRNAVPVWKFWTSHLVHCPQQDASRCTGPVGGTEKRWLADEVLVLAPQYCRPGGPATANHLIHRAVVNKMSRKLGASGARNRSPRRKRGIPAEMPVLGTASSERETKETTTPPTSARDKRARSTSAQPDERQPPAGPAKRARKERNGQFGSWPDIPPTWELERDVRGHTETKTKLLTRSVHASDSGTEASTPVDSLPLSSYENLVMWSQPTQENKETVPPSFCPCFKHLSGYFPGCWDETRSVGLWEGPQTKHRNSHAERSDETREGNVTATTWKRVVAAATAHPSGSTQSRTLSTGHHPSRSTRPVGGTQK